MSDGTIPEWSVGTWSDNRNGGSGGILARYKNRKTIQVAVPQSARAADVVAALRLLADKMEADIVNDLVAHLVGAVDLLKRGGKEAAASDKIFEQIIRDHERSIERGRSYLYDPN